MKNINAESSSSTLIESNLKLVETQLKLMDYSKIDDLKTANEKWEYIRNIILFKLDKIAPLKKVTMKSQNKFPWFDLELYRVKKTRDIS